MLDERWDPRPYPREELARALVAGGVAGPAGHPHHNVFGNIRMLVEHDPDKLFGLSDMPEPFGFEDIVRIVGEASGVPIDALATEGSPDIDADAVLDACEAMGERLAAAARRGERVLFATGHPGDLDPLYGSIAELAASHGAKIVRPGEGESWSDEDAGARLDDRVPRRGGDGHGRRASPPHPSPGRRWSGCSRRSDPTSWSPTTGSRERRSRPASRPSSIADVNDSALIVAKAQGRTEVVVVLDDHVPAEAYWPCFQAVAARF